MQDPSKFLEYGGYGAAPTTTKQWINEYRDLFPALLTISILAISGSSVVNGIRLLNDPHAIYWVGHLAYGVVLIPLLIVVAHIVQSYMRKPVYFAVLASCVGPPVISFVIGMLYNTPIMGIVGTLQSTDCITFREKFHLSQAYKTAETYYDNCISTLASNSSLSNDQLRKQTVMSQCPNYKHDRKTSGFAKEWKYLEELETKEFCSGWCYNDEKALWSHNPVTWSSCSLAAAESMQSSVQRNTWRMMLNGLLGFVIAGTAIILVTEFVSRSEDPSLQW
jgi:hypothetical protein